MSFRGIHICHSQTDPRGLLSPSPSQDFIHFYWRLTSKRACAVSSRGLYCHCAWQVLAFCHEDQSTQKVRSEVSNNPGEGMSSPVECGLGTGPETCCPLWNAAVHSRCFVVNWFQVNREMTNLFCPPLLSVVPGFWYPFQSSVLINCGCEVWDCPILMK